MRIHSLRKALQSIPEAHIVTVDINFHEGRMWEGGNGQSIGRVESFVFAIVPALFALPVANKNGRITSGWCVSQREAEEGIKSKFKTGRNEQRHSSSG